LKTTKFYVNFTLHLLYIMSRGVCFFCHVYFKVVWPN